MILDKRLGVLFFFIVLTEVAAWTIDLPEVRKYLFEKHEKEMEINKNKYEDYANRDKIFYSNGQILEDNKLHNEKEKYAAEFGYHSYMEKKVEEIVHDGSAYLEGLRRSLENFNRFLEECNRRNISMPQNPVESNLTMTQTLSNAPEMADSSIPSEFNNTRLSDLLEMNSTRLGTFASNGGMSCRRATEVSERVRRYADLAMWATRRLQDVAYAAKYQQTDKYEENELILKLAWFLDQLALLTGYEPEHKAYLQPESIDVSTTSPMPPTLVPQNQELINSMINCVKANSTVPATIRCQYMLPLPELVQQIVGTVSTTSPIPPTLVPQNQELINSMINCVKANSTVPATIRCQYMLPLPELFQQIVDGTSTSSPEVNSDVQPIPPLDSNSQQSMEILIATDDFRNPRRLSKRSPNPDEYYVPIPVHEKPKPIVDFIVKKLTNLKEIVKTVKKHAVADFATQIAIHRHIHKRSIEDDSSLLLNQLSNTSKPIVKSNETIDKNVLQHLPISEVSIINTKSFKKRSINDNASVFNFINKLSNYKTNANSHKANVKSVKRRSIDDPFSKLANYYIKYKVWDNSNPLQEKYNNKQQNFEVNNNLQSKTIAKRSLFHKKNRHLLLKSNTQKPKIKNLPKKEKNNAIRNLLEKKHKKIEKKLHKVSKRSLLYEQVYLPRIPSNPMGDISYYVKFKEGHEFRPSLTQAAQVRLGLQQVFQTGNIEVVRRYGANYNPAVPAPLYLGIIKSMADS